MATILMINTVPKDFLHHMAPHIKALKLAGNRVVLASAGSPDCLINLVDIKRDYFDCGIVRGPRLISDVIALLNIYKVIFSIKPNVVHTISPKAGLLGVIAGFCCLVPIRTHTFTGQVWANKRGVVRFLLKSFDVVISLLCTHLLTDSASQKKFLIDNGVAKTNKISVLGNGSICGIDPERFKRKNEVRKNLREKFTIGESDVVFLFMGRLNRDKGVYDLIEAFQRLNSHSSKVWLLLVGVCEDEQLTEILLNGSNRIFYHKYSSTPENFYWMSDVLCLPSYREGFGNVIIEAAAASLPCMASRIYGITDAVEDGYSGMLHEVGNVKEIKACFEYWIENSQSVTDMGNYARQRAVEKFSTKNLVKEFLEMYRKLGVNI
uniref:glycosyltransferase n=1 Tax=Polynucleobacter sp. TaxID=2029855 RepID=UPI0040474468